MEKKGSNLDSIKKDEDFNYQTMGDVSKNAK